MIKHLGKIFVEWSIWYWVICEVKIETFLKLKPLSNRSQIENCPSQIEARLLFKPVMQVHCTLFYKCGSNFYLRPLGCGINLRAAAKRGNRVMLRQQRGLKPEMNFIFHLGFFASCTGCYTSAKTQAGSTCVSLLSLPFSRAHVRVKQPGGGLPPLQPLPCAAAVANCAIAITRNEILYW